jgi:anti-sigma-K factor RskA
MKDICSRPLKLLGRYFDGEATDHEREVVENHLRECQACRAQLDSLKGIHTLVATPVEKAARQEDFPWVWEKIERRIRTQEKPSALEILRERMIFSPFWRKRVWVPALAAALLVMVIAAPFLMEKTSSPEAASVVVYVESQTNNVMVYEPETDQETVAVIWLFEEPDDESPST